MSLMPPQDALFLLGESRENPTHVTALQIFRPPAGSGPEFLEHLHGVLTDARDVKSAFTRRPARSWSTGGAWAWEPAEDLDLTEHVRRTAIPAPGRIRELLEHVSALHARLLDRSRPLWEAELVEGLADGRFALVTKLHHSMFDGITLTRHLLSGLSTDPAGSCVAPWTRTRPSSSGSSAGGVGELLAGVASVAGRAISGAPDLLTALGDAITGDSALIFQAPHTRFNDRLSGSRRFAGQAWDHARLEAVAERSGASVNDVGLAMCGGALRAYLSGRGELPEASLVAMVPVSLRGTDTSSEGTQGNSWGSVLCDLGTDLDDAGARLERVHASMRDGKQALRRLDPLYAMVLNLASIGLAALPSLRLLPQPPRPVFNLIVSNVPSTTGTMYFDGAELTDNYPVSMVSDGQALNITLMRYVDEMAFGITGCPKAVPHLQSLLGLLEDALVDLESAPRTASGRTSRSTPAPAR